MNTPQSADRPVAPVVYDAICNTMYLCPICNRKVTLKHVLHHHTSSCQTSDISVYSILSSSINQPLSIPERQLTTHLVQWSLNTSNGNLQIDRPQVSDLPICNTGAYKCDC